MKKRILPLIFSVIVTLAMLHPLCANAQTLLDPDAAASLTLYYQKNGITFPEQNIGIYRVAQAYPNGSFELVEPFSSYPINIQGITTQEHWQYIAQTLWSYIVADQVAPDWEETTDENGTVCFSGLKTGLYFVPEVVAENADGTYIFNRFMVYVPSPQSDGAYDYTVEANPKCTNFIPKTQYTVSKLWQDGGNQSIRPKEVIVDIYQDGVLQETLILSAANNWTYTWDVSGEDPGKWTVAERSVPDGYKVTVKQNGCHFSLINTSKSTPDNPKTGDSFAPLPWILAMCLSGMMLLILGIYSRRRK